MRGDHAGDVLDPASDGVADAPAAVAEAVFLSNRILVMAANPGRIHAAIPVDLPGPRTAETRLSRGLFHANHASNYLPLQVRMPAEKEQALALVDAGLDINVPTAGDHSTPMTVAPTTAQAWPAEEDPWR